MKRNMKENQLIVIKKRYEIQKLKLNQLRRKELRSETWKTKQSLFIQLKIVVNYKYSNSI